MTAVAVAAPVAAARDTGYARMEGHTAIQCEIDRLSDTARVMLRGAAVAGHDFDIGLAASASGLTEDEALPLVDELVATGLIRPTDAGRQFVFLDPLAREVAYESTPPGWRICAHRRVVQTLRRWGLPPVEIARHLEASARPGDAAAVAELTAAGHAFAVRAPAIAARRFGAALRLLPHRDTAAEERFGILVPLAESLAAVGHLWASRDKLLDALALLPSDAASAATRAEASCAGIEHLLGLHAEAHARLEHAAGKLPDRRGADAAHLLVELAVDGLWRSDWSATAGYAAQACHLASARSDRALAAVASTLSAVGLAGAGETDRARTSVEAAATAVDALTDSELASRLDAAFYLASAEWQLERFDRAVEHADRGIALAGATGRRQFLVLTLVAKAMALCGLGYLREAADCAQTTVDIARRAGYYQLLAVALSTKAWVGAIAGDTDEAVAAAEEGLATLRRVGRFPACAGAIWGPGCALLAAGDSARGATVVLDVVGDADASLLTTVGRCHAWHLLATATARRGQWEQADGWLRRLTAAVPENGGLRMPRCLAELARAEVLLARGEPAGALEAALSAAADADHVHARQHAARARLLAGRALSDQSQRTRAVQLLERAHVELADCGALRLRDQAAYELRRLGERIGRGGQRAIGIQGLDALSPREQEIAGLVAVGRTNKEIAAQLFLSTRTVERHLSHVFRKLDVSCRAQVGARLT